MVGPAFLPSVGCARLILSQTNMAIVHSESAVPYEEQAADQDKCTTIRLMFNRPWSLTNLRIVRLLSPGSPPKADTFRPFSDLLSLFGRWG